MNRLLVIDPQVDFCDPQGALSVPGADADMRRLAAFVDDNGDGIDSIDVTLDSHHLLDIAHPLWWQDPQGASPAPFTVLTSEAVAAGDWRTRVPEHQERSLVYLRTLEAGGRYPHVIWPPHCLIGTLGHTVQPVLAAALQRWETRRLRTVNYVIKGDNAFTEHFSAVRAEVPDPRDPRDGADPAWLASLAAAERLFVAGEALSHCVANTVRDLEGHVRPERMVLLTDTMSSVPGFEALGEAFVGAQTALGTIAADTGSQHL